MLKISSSGCRISFHPVSRQIGIVQKSIFTLGPKILGKLARKIYSVTVLMNIIIMRNVLPVFVRAALHDPVWAIWVGLSTLSCHAYGSVILEHLVCFWL